MRCFLITAQDEAYNLYIARACIIKRPISPIKRKVTILLIKNPVHSQQNKAIFDFKTFQEFISNSISRRDGLLTKVHSSIEFNYVF